MTELLDELDELELDDEELGAKYERELANGNGIRIF